MESGFESLPPSQLSQQVRKFSTHAFSSRGPPGDRNDRPRRIGSLLRRRVGPSLPRIDMALSPDVLDYVLGLEATAEPWADYAHLSSILRKAMDALLEADPRRQYVAWEIQVHDYHLSSDQADK